MCRCGTDEIGEGGGFNEEYKQWGLFGEVVEMGCIDVGEINRRKHSQYPELYGIKHSDDEGSMRMSDAELEVI